MTGGSIAGQIYLTSFMNDPLEVSLKPNLARAAFRSAAFFAAPVRPVFLEPPDDDDVILSVSVSMTLMSSSERSQAAEIEANIQVMILPRKKKFKL